VQALGGTIRCESVDGAGTSFYITLPRSQPGATPATRWARQRAPVSPCWDSPPGTGHLASSPSACTGPASPACGRVCSCACRMSRLRPP